MNALQRLIVAALALSATLATTALVVSPVAFAHSAQVSSQSRLSSSTAGNTMLPHTRNSKA